MVKVAVKFDARLRAKRRRAQVQEFLQHKTLLELGDNMVALLVTQTFSVWQENVHASLGACLRAVRHNLRAEDHEYDAAQRILIDLIRRTYT